jgi:Spy/CpxP family protein refolding chaperone
MNVNTRKTLRRAAALVTLAAASGLSAVAIAGPHGHGGHSRGGMGGPMMGMGIERMLDAVDATPEQRTQIDQIHRSARADLQGQRESGRALRDQMRSLFTQPTVDANAVEAVRQQMLAQHDRASQRMTQAMVEVSRVLTPAQRETIAERMSQRAERMQQRAERWKEHRQAREAGSTATPNR